MFGLCGFTLYFSVGAKTAASFRYDFGFGLKDQAAAYGGFASMCILTSLVYLVDVVFSLVKIIYTKSFCIHYESSLIESQ